MKKIMRLTENDLQKLVRKVLNEQPMSDGGRISKKHPTNHPFWIEMLKNVEGDNVSLGKSLSNQTLIINTPGGTYSITKK